MIRRINLLTAVFFIAISYPSQLFAQNHMHHDSTMHHHEADTTGKETGMQMEMSHAYSRNLPAGRNGSGTSWSPDASPMFMCMLSDHHNGSWMFHGSFFLRYNDQDVFDKGIRGEKKIDGPNWFMVLYNKNVGTKGLFNATIMASLDPFTVGESGYPLLF